MHSVHRDLETRYRRALDDIQSLQNTNGMINKRLKTMGEELNETKMAKTEIDTKIAFDLEKIKSLEREN